MVAAPSSTSTTSPAQKWLRSWFTRETATAWLFLIPSLIGFITFYAIPAIRGVYVSLTDWDLLTDPEFVGAGNYLELFQDDLFWRSLQLTAYYVLLNIPLQTMLALGLAVLMDRVTKSAVIRGLFIMPWLLPPVIVALIWLWMLDPTLGFINTVLQAIGFDRQPFLGSPDMAMPSIAMINIWQYTGYTALLFFAGLQTIPSSLYEAAAIDGASERRIFWSVTLPLLRPVMVFVLVTSIIGSFQIFDTIAVTTKGGPIDATRVIIWYIFEIAFNRFQMGYATAISMVLFVILIIATIVQMRILRSDESDLV
ncbi:MAG: sugar ABC transporter permease [Anaerolineales bacterium]|nr:sugar ABC transporter permease [Anaerolineales bacterium]MCB0013653.1 sugar ABC transporter permease [Anaerolineales bacterium]